MGVPLAEVIAVLDRAYPARLAEPWDTGIGLTCGDPHDLVDTVLVAVDVDAATVGQARRIGAQLLLTHHPLLFRPVQSVAAVTDKGRLVHELVRGGIAHIAAHTNADRAVGGVSDALAAALGLTVTGPLVPARDGDAREGLGRIGELSEPMRLGDFVTQVAARLPVTASGVRATGEAGRRVHRVAVCGGSGGSELAAVTAAGVDAYVTSDVTHHVAAEHAWDPGRPAIVEVAHWAGEWPWVPSAADLLRGAWPDRIDVTASTVRTDAWTLVAGAGGGRE